MKLPTEDDPIKDFNDFEEIRLSNERLDENLTKNDDFNGSLPTQTEFAEIHRRFAGYSNIERISAIGTSAFIFRYRN